MLPDGWTRRPLGELADLLTGFAFPSDSYVKPKDQESSVRLLRGDNVMQGFLLWEEPKHWPVAAMDGLERFQLVRGDVVIALDRPVTKAGLKCSVVKPSDLPCLLVQRVARLRASAGLDQGYLSQVVQKSAFVSHLIGSKTETAVPHVSPNDIRAFEVAAPTNILEQQRIARVLSSWDQAIATTELLLANRRRQQQSLLALNLCLSPANPDADGVADNGGYPASVQPGLPNLPPTPDGWRRVALGHHLTEVRRAAPLKPDDAYRLVTVKRSRGGVDLREVLTGREIKTPSQFYVRAGDFLISKRQIVHGACGIVPPELDGAVVSNEYAALNSDGQIDLRFLRYLSESRYFQQTCFHSSIGVHIEKMIFKTERWLKWPFNIPPLPVQHRIVEVLDTARREIDLIAGQIKRLKQEKAALMADLLTGKRRVRLPTEEPTP